MQENQATNSYLNQSPELWERVILRDIRAMVHIKLQRTLKTLHNIQSISLQIEERSWKERDHYNSIDQELSMIDGRYQKLQSQADEGKKVKKESAAKLLVKLNQDQIQRIAEILGVELGGDNENP